MNTQERINQMESPIARTLMQNFYDEMMEMLEWNGQSLASINRKIEKAKREKEPTPAEQSRIERARRVEIYREQFENMGEPTDAQLTFIEDEDRLYRNQVTFANLIGIEFDDE